MGLVRLLPFAVFLPLALHFFETFPNGWDQAEYVWCVKAAYLPHSPYLLFVFLGRGLQLLVPPAVALSLLSFAGALAALAALVGIVRESAPCAAGPDEAGARGTVAALLLAASPIFVRHAATQEVYALQLGFVLVVALLALSSFRRKHLLGGIVFGCALAVHNASIFLAPALAFLVVSRIGLEGRRFRALAVWAAASALTLGGFYALVAMLLPAESGARLADLLVYLRGMPPGLEAAPLPDPALARDSIAGLLSRLTDAGIASTRGPQATGPTGLTMIALAAAAVGALLLARRSCGIALFWLLWLTPFVVYELALGWNLDYGVYLVFVMPPLSVFAAEAVSAAFGWISRWRGLAVAAGVAVLLIGPGMQIAAHWGDAHRDRLRHDSVATLAALWAADALPENAVVVQPRSEWNANLLPLHSERRHVARAGGRLRLFDARARWTPMKPGAYRPLTTARLRELLAAGTPVFAYEAEPFAGGRSPDLDAGAFAWERVAVIDLAAAAERAGFRDASRFAGRSLGVYRVRESGASENWGPVRSK